VIGQKTRNAMNDAALVVAGKTQDVFGIVGFSHGHHSRFRYQRNNNKAGIVARLGSSGKTRTIVQFWNLLAWPASISVLNTPAGPRTRRFFNQSTRRGPMQPPLPIMASAHVELPSILQL
jgi:hypothetical protein